MLETLATREDTGQTALATREENEAFLGFVDMTPTFSVDLPGGLVSSFPMGSYPRPTVIRRPSLANLEFCATSIAPLQQLVLYLSRALESMNQTLIQTVPFQSAQRIWVVPVAARPADPLGDFTSPTSRTADLAPSPADMALSAVADIQHWLAVGQDQVATLAGYAPRSIKNWREGMDPYASTVRRLFDLHALLGSLTHRMGVDGTRLWLAGASQDGTTRRDLLADDSGLRSIISEASSILFERPSIPPVHALEFEEEMQLDVPRRPDLFTGPVRRARRRHT